MSDAVQKFLLTKARMAYKGVAWALGGGFMHVPGLLEKVRLTGLDEVYLVTRVNHEAQVADLLPIIYGEREIQSVPFLAMEAIPRRETPKSAGASSRDL